MKKIAFYFIIICSFAMYSCKPKTNSPSTEPLTASDLLNQSYGNDGKQKFNIYLPKNRTAASTPVIFLIHGGAWMSGDRSDFNSSIATYQSMLPDYAIVTLSYRLNAGSVNKFPTQEQDVKSCIEYVLTRNQDYAISQKFALMGISAGAHLATLYAYKYGATSFQPKAVVDVVGPVELIQAYNQVSSPVVKGWITSVAGNPATIDSLLYISSSPLRFVTASSAPTLILHGTADSIVPPQQALLLKNKLQSLGVVTTYKLYPGEGHGFSPLVTLDALNLMKTFLTNNVK